MAKEGKDANEEVVLNVLKARHYANVLSNVYSNAEGAEEVLESRKAQPTPSQTEWRRKTERKFTTRKLDQFREKRLQRKIKSKVKERIRFRIPKVLSELARAASAKDDGQSEKQEVSAKQADDAKAGVKIVYANRDAEPPSRSKTLRKRREEKEARRKQKRSRPDSQVTDLPDRVYDIPVDVENLYKLKKDKLEELPLELFDSTEDKTPEEWIALGASSGGTPCQVRVYAKRKWSWGAARAVSFDAQTGKYEIKTAAGPTKRLPRLSVRFDAEDAKAFASRVVRAEARREEARAVRRYTKLIESQNEDAFRPVAQGRLHRIVERLVTFEEKLVLARRDEVKTLLREVRDDYVFSMKAHLVEYSRRVVPGEEGRLAKFSVPKLPNPPPVADLAVVPLPTVRPRVVKPGTQYPESGGEATIVPRVDYTIRATQSTGAIEWIDFLRARVTKQHYSRFKNTTKMLLLMNRLWDSVSKQPLFDDQDDDKRPWGLYRFVDHQNALFNNTAKEIDTEWRSRIANTMKVDLANTFRLFDDNLARYKAGPLNRFLRLVNMMLRAQLSSRASETVDTVRGVVSRYDAEAAGEAAGVAKPLFVFKLTAQDGAVEYQPKLDTVETTLVRALDVPNKLKSFVTVESEVVPLLNLPETPLLGPECADLFAKVDAAKQYARGVIADNIAGPNELKKRYSAFKFLLGIKPEEYVKAWFEHGTESTKPTAAKSPVGKKARSPKHSTPSRRRSSMISSGFTFDRSRRDSVKGGGKGGATDQKERKARKAKPHTLKETRAEIQKYVDAIEGVKNASAPVVDYMMIRVDANKARNSLTSVATALKEGLLKGLETKSAKLADKLQVEFKAILAKLVEVPKDTESMAEIKKYMEDTVSKKMPLINSQLEEIQQMQKVLRDYWHKVSPKSLYQSWRVGTFPERVLAATKECKANLSDAASKFEQLLEKEKIKFRRDLNEYQKQIDKIKEFGWCSKTELAERASSIEALNRTLDKSADLVESFRMREKLFEQKPGDYDFLDELRAELKPHVDMWSQCQLFRASHAQWITCPFNELDPKAMADKVNDCLRKTMRMRQTMSGLDLLQPADVATKMANEIKSFQKLVPVIVWLRNPGLEGRHWEQINKVLETNFSKKGPDSLSEVLATEELLEERKTDLEEVCGSADKEYELKRQLKDMEDEWEPVAMNVEQYKVTFIFKGADEILELLDDQTLKVQAMRGSPYIKPFEKRCKEWERRVKGISECILEWLKVQGTWLYLEPIFSSPDIQQQMKKESRLFMQVDAFWKKTMQSASEEPRVAEFFEAEPSQQIWSLTEKFQRSNETLDKIQKGLSQYLETKRLAFPRFYFLSDDELLSILSQTKNVEAVQPHMNKCFDNIKSLTFDKKKVICAMNSSAGESVPFMVPVDPNKGEARGNVEVWLKMVEAGMRDTLRDLMGKGIKDYAKPTRPKWIMSKIMQVVLMVDQLFWTREVEAAVSKGIAGLKEYAERTNKELLEIVELVRGKLSRVNRKTLGSLTILNVHGRDVVDEMIENKVVDVNQFEWLAQMRYYWENDGKEEGVMKVRMINATLKYGYEYLGNAGRLVITQLTDRCYRTLMGAVHLHLGGSPEGPAGTGKTETVKDLSKSLAIQCVVFNCSDSITVSSMARMFKGLASTGGWACFDEFNRIDIEVLSVIGQMLATIQRAVHEELDVFSFEGVAALPLKHTCTPFVTMNPGYAGRTELPDNLKVLFRTVAMMIPDYARIAEIMLYSMGYEDAVPNSVKIVACLQLSSEQLSSQYHYDFGMRAVKAILVAAGNLKRKYPTAREDQLCLSAIMDVNLPKFTSEDIPLFVSITKDLFPGVQKQETDYSAMEAKICIACEEMNLQPLPTFIQKVIQLYETVRIRHGLMVVGDTYAGKSSNIKVLQRTITMLAEEKVALMNPVDTICINPKSITSNQLYGSYDKQTMEWNDGIVPVLVRKCVADTRERRKWIVFDGPVDALWIENMNTVLDDNKKLCLASGEIIKLSEWMTMMFEVEDLSVASPATISRVGMVYMEPVLVGWRPLVLSWLQTLPENIAPHKDLILRLFDWLVPPSLLFLRKACKTLIPTLPEMTLVGTLIKQLDSLLDEFRDEYWEAKREEAKGRARDECKFTEDPLHDKHIEGWFQFSLIWSIGCICIGESRPRFDVFFRDLVAGNLEINELKEGEKDDGLPRTLDFRVDKKTGEVRILMDKKWREDKVGKEFPKEGSIFDCQWSRSRAQWVNWMTTIPDFKAPNMKTTQFHEVVVPTVETVRAAWILGNLITHQKHVLFVGPTGTGKSVIINQKILDDLDKSVWMPLMMTFSARTDANQTQDTIDGKLDRRKQGVLGPPIGKRCVVVVDDLNMPAKEFYGAQPPIELLRQWMDYGGWYNRKERSFVALQDIQFVASMGPPLGGRQPITERYTRHYASVGLVDYGSDSLKRIYTIIVGAWLSTLKASCGQMRGPLVEATVELYDTVRKGLLPTPTKSHYTFNLRDISKVFQGILMVGNPAIRSSQDLVPLWLHETRRVFCDRLSEEKDIDWFDEQTDEGLKKYFRTDLKSVYNDIGEEHKDDKDKPKLLIYADFADRKGKRMYKPVPSLTNFKEVVNIQLEDYNGMNSSGEMNLVLFNAAIEHVSRIARILRLPFGNALLVGVGGSGRQSLSKLACHICDYTLFQISMTATYGVYTDPGWKLDLIQVMQIAGVKNEPVVFLISDTQIKDEQFVEDINNILNNGEVPNLFPSDAKQEIIEKCMQPAREAGKTGPQAIFQFFVERCRANIHMVIALSPIGDAFRNRLRMFPSLVNCTTIDWFHPWPREALASVAKVFLSDIEVDPEDRKRNKELQTSIVKVCVDMQERVTKLSDRFRRSLRRYNYVTPTSYLELIKTFQKLFKQSRDDIGEKKARYDNGLQKLSETETAVASMQEELKAMQPGLIAARKEVKDTMVVIAGREKDVSKTRNVIAGEEKIATDKANAAKAIEDECQAELDVAMPALNEALEALKVLKQKDITELRSFKQVSDYVKIAMEGLCYMFEQKPVLVGEPGRPKEKDFWQAAKKNVLTDSKLLHKILTYDKDNMKASVINKVQKLLKKENWDVAKIKKASVPAGVVATWVEAMETFYRVNLVVIPKKEQLKKARAEVAVLMEQLKEKKEALDKVEKELGELRRQFDEVKRKEKELSDKVQETSDRLQRAKELIVGLTVMKEGWIVKAKELKIAFDNVVGDVLISSGVMAYLGAFTIEYRNECVDAWKKLLSEVKVPASETYKLHRVLGDPVEIQRWRTLKLPNDDFSADNAILVTQSTRYPLCIDPEGQANMWIKNLEADNKLKVLKQTDATFAKEIPMCVQYGTPVLVEGVQEKLDPLLEPILLKQWYRSGTSLVIELGAETLTFNPNFKIYFTTSFRNPHYPPEVSTKVVLTNFMITPEGLADQMCNFVVQHEQPKLAKQANELVVKIAAMAASLKAIEDQVLKMLKRSKGNILDNQELVDKLKESKIKRDSVDKKMKDAERKQELVQETRTAYFPLGSFASHLFFCITLLANVDPMYQYSLTWYNSVFERAMDTSAQEADVEDRINAITDTFKLQLYENVCRSLFEKDKLLFSFMLSLNIMEQEDRLDQAEVRFLLTGGIIPDKLPENPAPEWLSQNSWGQVCNLKGVSSAFGDAFMDLFLDDIEYWEEYYQDPDPYHKDLPEALSELTNLQRMLILRCLRPDRVLSAIQTFVEMDPSLGKEFIEPPTFDLAKCFEDSSATMPLIFILSPGVDPKKDVYALGKDMGFQAPERLIDISLGQGQGVKAEKAITRALEDGSWVLLQNCHLSVSWLPRLEKIVQDIDPDTTNKDFRLWLTSMPDPRFPVSILQIGVKMTNEPPKGLRANLKLTYAAVDDDLFESSQREDKGQFQKMMFGLAFFHALVQERRTFGPLGWNIAYGFNDSDQDISRQQISQLLDGYEVIPFKALRYLIGQLNYGGRVTDDWDRRLITYMCEDFVTEDILDQKYAFESKGVYKPLPRSATLDDYNDYIEGLPLNDMPSVFGFDGNAIMIKNNKETSGLLGTLLGLQPRTVSGGGKSREDVIEELANDIAGRLPDLFEIERAKVKYPVVYSESMNTVFVQELARFNRLLSTVKTSLAELVKALKGQVVMSSTLEAMGDKVFDGLVPDNWKKVSYPSLKPLSGWVSDFLMRLDMFDKWMKGGSPNVYWISGFYFTQSFLTGTKQNYARKYTIPIDDVVFDFEVVPEIDPADQKDKPEDGCFIHGLFLEGARWGEDENVILDAMPKQLYCVMPTIQIKPCSKAKLPKDKELYKCPVYKTSTRQGQLSTTGHSTNFVLAIDIRTRKSHPEKYWVRRGVAMLTQLDT